MAKMEPTTSPFLFARNPFGPLVGQPLDDQQVDIAEINAESFRACQQLVSDVAAGGFSAALTVFGDSGTGKTHLLGRVRRWLEPQPANLFVFVRMETSPAGIWRHIRRCLALALLRPGTMERLLGQRKSELETLANRDLSIVLEHLLEGRRVRDSSAWLRGEGLPEEALKELRLGAPSLDDDLEVTSRHLVMAICGLLQPGAVVFCMDQIEAVRSSPADQDGPHAFGKAVSCLIDETKNAAVICCEQSSFVNLLEQLLDNSTKLRLMGRRAAIRPLSWEQARRLIGARLDTVPELRAIRAGLKAGEAGGCWPLPEAQIKEVFQDNAAPARKIIARCKDLFDLCQPGEKLALEPLDEALQRMFEERLAARSAAESEAILRNGVPLLARSAGLKYATAASPSPMDFMLDGDSVTVALCNEMNTTSLAHRLKKIGQAWKPGAKRRLILLRDTRIPIGRNARACQQRIQSLEEQGGRLVTVSQEAVAALAALRRLLSDAESGDLAQRGEAVKASEVEQWIAGHMPSALEPLMAEFGSQLGNGQKRPDISAKLAALLAEKKLMKVEEAALSLEVSPGEVEECARRDPRQFGILGGRVPALFQPVAAAEAR